MANQKKSKPHAEENLNKINLRRQRTLFDNEKGLTPNEIAKKRILEWKENPIGEDIKHIKNLTQRFGQNTRVLELSYLGLSEFPESLRKLINVENIDLEGNKIRSLPNWIGELEELKGLNLKDNFLSVLPNEIVKLNKLKIFWLINNKLTSLPKGLQNIDFKELRLIDNPGLKLPKSIIARSPNEILRYYFESQAEDTQPLLELKLILVGRGKAGKTTIVKQLSGEDPDENEQETHSISIRELNFKCAKGDVRTRAWDFGGQEILHSTHQFFLTERSLYLLVLEPRTGLAQKDAEYWLKLIESQGAGSPVIIALNWSHKRPWRVDEVRLKRKFPFIVSFISTDALKGEGISELHKSIIQTVEQKMHDVWLPFPKNWRNIKNDVAGMSNNFLSYKQYTTLCAKYGETRTDAQADLAGILHALGLALYFGKDPRLHDTRVLNPGWVTGGVYAIIRSQYVEKKDGHLLLSDMKAVLKEAETEKVIAAKDYPPRTHRFILELMKAFQLCYASEDSDDRPTRYLVPELLPEFEPQMKERWEKAEVRLRYRYNALPPGLLSRFIVQTHALNEGAPHWRHGVVLKHSDAQALIREENDRSELHVFISGRMETRGVLVAIVRRELQILHSDMKMQPIEELELTGENEQWISVKALQEVESFTHAKQKLPIQPDGTAVVNVPLELDKLIPLEARKIDLNKSKLPLPIRLFVSYAHEDERSLKRLDSILDILEQQYGLTSWTDKRLIAGMEWDEEIRNRLEEMDIFLFIASQTSLVRPYIKDPELRRAKERKDNGEIEIVTVKLEPCAIDEDDFLGKLQRLAPNVKSVAESTLKSVAWEQIRKDLLPVIKKLRDKKKI